MLPWEYHSDLTSDRLKNLVQLLAAGRRSAVEQHDPLIGGDSWTRGVCAYRYGCHQIETAAGTEGFEWLSIIDSGQKFQFKVGVVPMRFWRGDPAEPSERVLVPTDFEQGVLDLGETITLDGVLFRVSVTADDDGTLLQADFVALRHESPETIWRIPFVSIAAPLVTVDDSLPAGRELDSPQVGLPDEDEAESENPSSEEAKKPKS